MLILNKIYAITYRERQTLIRHTLQRLFIFEKGNLEILDACLAFKLGYSISFLKKAFNVGHESELMIKQKEFLRRLTFQVLFYGLSRIYGESDSLKSTESKIGRAVAKYLKSHKSPLFSWLAKLPSVVFYAFSKSSQKSQLSKAFLLHHIPPKAILNGIITLLYVEKDANEREILAERLLKQYFPWVKPSTDTEIIDVISDLWHGAHLIGFH